jgi:hypothetical protein
LQRDPSDPEEANANLTKPREGATGEPNPGANQRYDDHVVLVALELIDRADVHTAMVLVSKQVAQSLDLR